MTQPETLPPSPTDATLQAASLAFQKHAPTEENVDAQLKALFDAVKGIAAIVLMGRIKSGRITGAGSPQQNYEDLLWCVEDAIQDMTHAVATIPAEVMTNELLRELIAPLIAQEQVEQPGDRVEVNCPA